MNFHVMLKELLQMTIMMILISLKKDDIVVCAYTAVDVDIYKFQGLLKKN